MKKLTKSATDRQVSGVLGGIAEYFGIDLQEVERESVV